jgi:DNA mismatch endonuclease (patch repair protein)
MQHIRRTGTAPELMVRQALSRHRIRYRVANGDIAGSPDLANRSRRWAIFVHGCFWHRHAGCPRASLPVRNADYWQRKFDRNVKRDAAALRRLRTTGWHVYVVWECCVDKSAETVARRIAKLTKENMGRG